ncbi:MAG: LD-carboxypeptidase [Erysipelotrichaceae bacterium]|nr:LD-carboxypeptidase [Erysipelotrichaceae bacterium]
MIYPEFLKKDDLIGICAPSAGVGHKLEAYETSLEVLKEKGYLVKESASVRRDDVRSASASRRGKELNELVKDPEVKAIICAAGGDFMLEMLPYVDFEAIRKNPKWLSGASDPTNLLFTVTTMLDVATLYGFNGAGFTFEKDKPQKVFFDYLSGKTNTQHSYKTYNTFLDTINDIDDPKPVRWIAKNDVEFSGRLIGGCLEVIDKLIGTRFDHTNEFLAKYKEDGIVWYLDIFNKSSYDFYLSLLQYKNAGWFDHCTGVMISRPAFPNVEDKKLDYIKAADKALGKIPHICEMDIGHTDPAMTLINGALIKVSYSEGKGKIAFKLK